MHFNNMITKEQKHNHVCPAVLKRKNVHCNGVYPPTFEDTPWLYTAALPAPPLAG